MSQFKIDEVALPTPKQVEQVKRMQANSHFGKLGAVYNDGWTTGPAAVTYDMPCKAGPFKLPEHCSLNWPLFIGGPCNGQRRDVSLYGSALYVQCHLDGGVIAWYERCLDGKAYVWNATVDAIGVELRETN